MAKQKLLDKIIGDAEERAREILSEAESSAETSVASATAERASLLESARRIATAAAPETIKRRKAMAELESKKLALKEKQDLISECYRAALDRIRKSDRYEDLLVAMIVSAAEEGDSVVFSAADFNRVNREKTVAAAGKKAGVKLSLSEEKGAFGGGIVLRGKDCDKNLTLEVELEALRAEEDLCAKVLFS